MHSYKALTFLKVILSAEMIEVLVGREVDLEVGRETAALTAAMIAMILKKN